MLDPELQRPQTTPLKAIGLPGSRGQDLIRQPLLLASSTAPALGARAPTSHGDGRKARPLSGISITPSTFADTESTFASSPSRRGRPRFTSEERLCFSSTAFPRRVPTPASGLSMRELCLSHSLSEPGLRIKEDSWRSEDDLDDTMMQLKLRDTPLPLETKTAHVLEQIYPQVKNSGLQSGSSSPKREDCFSSPSKSMSCPLPQVKDRDNNPKDGAVRLRRKTIFEDSGIHMGCTNSANAGNSPLSDRTNIGKTINVGRLQKFRMKMLDKFQTVKGAFEEFASNEEEGLEQQLGKKQFSRFLNQYFHGLTREEHMQIFDFLDGNRDGYISILEFHTAIEAAAPIRTVEDLRRKWIALGYSGMRAGVQAMGWMPDNQPEGSGNTSTKRLTLQEFSSALLHAGIDDPDEHLFLFVGIQERGDKHGTVSLDQLLAALTAVSPPLLLEDLRFRLLRKFGTLEDAYEGICPEGATGLLTRKNFCVFLESKLDFSIADAHKCFDFIDVNRNQRLSRREVISALRLAEPNLFLEDVRRKVRQRFRSIELAIKSTKEKSNTYDEESPHDAGDINELMNPKKTQEKSRTATGRKSIFVHAIHQQAAKVDPMLSVEDSYLDILKKVHLDEGDIRLFLNLIDVNGDMRIAPSEISRAVALFAPSCILEDLRLFFIQSHTCISDAFTGLSSAGRDLFVTKSKDLEKMFRELRVPTSVPTQDIFQLVESRRGGGIFIDELVAALNSVGPGTQAPLNQDQLDARARQQIRWQLAPFRRGAAELRGSLRVLPSQTDELQGSHRIAVDEFDGNDCNQRRLEAHKETLLYQPVQASYRQVKQCTDKKIGRKVSEQVHGYYSSASSRLHDHMPLLSPSQHRAEHYLHCNKHRKFLAREAPFLTVGM